MSRSDTSSKNGWTTGPRALMCLMVLAVSASCGGTSAPADSAGPRIVQPGAPGEASRTFEVGDLADIGGTRYTDADVRFMSGMIPHHAQALDMTALVPDRAANEAFKGMALRMRISQRDEIGLMTRWLVERGEEPLPTDAHRQMLNGAMPSMHGMLTQDQMQQLTAAEGVAFERLFLEFMIQHHQGAIMMVRELYNSSGAAEDTTVNFFASEVDSDQVIEIRRMQQMLAERR